MHLRPAWQAVFRLQAKGEVCVIWNPLRADCHTCFLLILLMSLALAACSQETAPTDFSTATSCTSYLITQILASRHR